MLSTGQNISLTSLFVIGTLLFIVAVVVIFRIRKYRTRQRLQRFSELDEAWDIDTIKKQVEDIFFRIQQARTEGSLDTVKEILSDRMLEELQGEIEKNKKQNHKLIIKDPTFASVTITSAKDFEDDSKDRFKAVVSGSMINYLENLHDGQPIGNHRTPETIFQSWYFKRSNDQWLLDEVRV